MKNKSGIYQIRNIVNDKVYIGSAIYLKGRKNIHLYHLRNNKHHSQYLQKSFNKYGEENFVFEVLEFVESKENLIEREQFYIDTLNPDYNICKTAGSRLGTTHSIEVKRHLSVIRKENFESGKIITWNKGINCPPRSEDIKNRISETLTGIKRKPFSKEHRKKISDSRVGKSFVTKEGKDAALIKRRKHPNYKSDIIKRVKLASLAKQKKVSQIDPITNKIIKEWNSVKDIMEFYNIKSYKGIKDSNEKGNLYRNCLWKYQTKK